MDIKCYEYEPYYKINIGIKTSSPYMASKIWPSAEYLANYMHKTPNIVKEKLVLELGCGCGLPGLLASKLGATKVVLADSMIENAEESILLNPGIPSNHIIAMKLKWGIMSSQLLEQPKQDVILCSDIFYEQRHYNDIFSTIITCAHEHTLVYIVYHVRSSNRCLDMYITQWGLSCRLLEVHESADGVRYEILELRMKK